MAYRTGYGGLDSGLMLRARDLRGEALNPALRVGGGQDAPAETMAKIYNFPKLPQSQTGGKKQPGQPGGGQQGQAPAGPQQPAVNGRQPASAQPPARRPAAQQKPVQKQPDPKEELRRRIYSMLLRDKRLYREGKPDMDVLETLTDMTTIDAGRELAKKDGRQLGDIVREIVERYLGNR